jgi:putative ABC transport system ATP-binding protein
MTGLDLCLADLRWAFDSHGPDFLVLESLEVKAGQVAALVGPSGAGKSTLLFLLAGLETPRAGSLLWGDCNLAALSSTRRDRWRRANLGLVFQDFQLVPELTALENVLLPLTFGRWSVPRGDRRRAADLLERLGVGRPVARASTLSRGEMQRTALARALLGRPPVVLADEPTASLDAANEAAVAQLLLDYARQEGATVVVSTHQSLLRDGADLKVTLAHGQIVKEPE